MRLGHFEAYSPVCPVCRSSSEPGFPVELSHVESERDGDVLEGLLVCSNPACRCEFPIIDAIPIIVPDVRGFVASNAFTLLARRDLGSVVESLVGDCCGPSSAFDVARQHVGNYATSHYGDWFAGEEADDSSSTDAEANVRGLLQTLWSSVGEVPNGPLLDVGCGLGRATFELASSRGALTLGIERNVAMIRVASELLRRGRTTVPRRRVGLVYDRDEVTRHCEHPELVDFWIADAAALPFSASTCSGVACLNVLDCVADPYRLLTELVRTTGPGGVVAMACPYDWSESATRIEGWLGGHSQRSPTQGSSKSLVRDLLTPGRLPQSLPNVEILAEFDRLPWEVRLHDRSVMRYDVHGFVVRVHGQGPG